MYRHFYEYSDQVSDKKKKQLGIVYTPPHIVDWINKSALSAWNSDSIPVIVDPCCGTGVFLHDMALKISDRWGIDFDEVCKKYIHGYDVDPDALKILKQIMPHCNVTNTDSLREDYSCFDIIVTNPPYIRIQNLDTDTRNFLQQSFDFCEGDTDIYIAFFEKFAKSGKIVGMICPNSWIRNKGTKRLRKHLYDTQVIENIVDFKDKFVFKDAQTYTSIVCMTPKGCQLVKFSNDITDEPREIDYKESSPSHVFSGLKAGPSEHTKSLLDYCDIKVGLATLCDKVYFGEMTKKINDSECVFKTKLGEYKIECAVLKKCVKASKITDIKENTYIIFPYDKSNKLIDESVFSKLYPLAYQYLTDHKTLLLQRDKGKIKANEWYGYGRTQGLSNNKRKLLVPPMHKDKLTLRFSDEKELYISGYAIFPNVDISLSEVQKLFETQQLFDWITQRGKTLSGGWYGISKELFKSYNF